MLIVHSCKEHMYVNHTNWQTVKKIVITEESIRLSDLVLALMRTKGEQNARDRFRVQGHIRVASQV